MRTIPLIIVCLIVFVAAFTIETQRRKINRLEWKIEVMRGDWQSDMHAWHRKTNKLYNQMNRMKWDTTQLYEVRQREKYMTKKYYDEVRNNKRLKYCQWQLQECRKDQEFLDTLKTLLK